MRIIGGKDYYDSVQGTFGVSTDDPVRFIRTNKIITDRQVRESYDYFHRGGKLEWYPFRSSLAHTHFKYAIRILDVIRPFEVYFCGVVYTGYKICINYQPEHITYSFNSLIRYMKRYVKEEQVNSLINSRSTNIDIISRNFDKKDREYFIQNKLSVATNNPNSYVTDQVHLNGYNLGMFGFQQVVDPFSAYQLLEAWISNDLACQVDGPDIIDDKIKIQKHGFDLKTSFRHPVKVK